MTSKVSFPCNYPIKIIGYTSDTFEQEVLIIVKKIFKSFDKRSMIKRFSENKKYISITISLFIHTDMQLSEVIKALRNHPKVILVL